MVDAWCADGTVTVVRDGQNPQNFGRVIPQSMVSFVILSCAVERTFKIYTLFSYNYRSHRQELSQ